MMASLRRTGKYGFSALLVVALVAACDTAIAPHPPLMVKGKQLFYQDREVRLQGVAVGDPVLARERRPLSDYATIAKEWNANAVRISVHPGVWKEDGEWRVMRRLVREVNAALEAGMFVIVTWHAIGIPDGYMQAAPHGMMHDVYDTNFALAQDFWRAAARRFGSDGRIVFELWNEPVYKLPPLPGEGWANLKPFWQTLIADIRSEGAKNLILASSYGWGYALQGVKHDLLEDTNTAYAWHLYAGTDKNAPYKWMENLDGLNHVKPVVVTEWGFEPESRDNFAGTAQTYGNVFRERILRGEGLHYTAWCWHPEWSPRMLQPDWQTPTAFGRFVKETLAERPAERLARP